MYHFVGKPEPEETFLRADCLLPNKPGTDGCSPRDGPAGNRYGLPLSSPPGSPMKTVRSQSDAARDTNRPSLPKSRRSTEALRKEPKPNGKNGIVAKANNAELNVLSPPSR